MKAKPTRKTYLVRVRRTPAAQVCGPDLIELPAALRDYVLDVVGRGEIPERLRTRWANATVTVKFRIVEASAV